MNEVTFVLLTCGEKTERLCLQAIEPFRQYVDFVEIRNVFPQIKALNKMIESVKTQYFVPIDADMVLNSDAWRRLSAALDKYRFREGWHSILFPLWDTLTERRILALKLLKTSVMKENPFHDSPTPDVEHFKRLTAQGYSCVQEFLKEHPIGKHIIKGKHFCYNKFRDVYQTYRAHNFEWDSGIFMGGDDLESKAKAHFDFFLRKYMETENKDYLHCIAGMMDGIISPLENRSKTLERGRYRMNSKYIIETFFNWYIADCRHLRSGFLV